MKRQLKSNNPKIRKKEYVDENVYEMAKQRIRDIYKEFDHVAVSSSFGKDSTVAFELVVEVATELDRLPVEINFFDEELLTHHTIDFVRRSMKRPELKINWFCLEIKHRNACSNHEPYWFPWDKNKKDLWVREMPKEAITSHPKFRPYQDSIPDFLARKYPKSFGNVCEITGVRAQESLRRYSVVMNKRNRNYISVSPQGGNVWSAHPIYDWQAKDIWKYIEWKGHDYNEFYDVLNRTHLHDKFLAQRLCAPLGEEPLRGLWIFKEIDHNLYNNMLRRVAGVATAARYGNTELYAIGLKEPPKGHTWESYLHLVVESYDDEKVRETVTKGINTLIDRHHAQSLLEITETTHDPVSGCCWKFLCQTATRGDLKGRTQSKMPSLAFRSHRKLNITLAQAIMTYGTEKYKKQKMDRLKRFRGEQDNDEITLEELLNYEIENNKT